MKTMKVILPAAEINEGTLVTKVTGQVQYTLHREIKVYGILQ
jgi:hypothetical protein